MTTDTESKAAHVKLKSSISEEAVTPSVPTVSLRDRFIKKKRRIENSWIASRCV